MKDLPITNVKTKSVPAVERSMLILEELACSQNGLSVSELARNLNLAKSSTYGLLLTLERLGYLNRNERNGRYRFGVKIFTLANMALNGLSLRKIATPHLRKLMTRTGLTVHMAIQERNEAVVIEKVEASYTPKVETWVGKRMGIHCTAVGKALISDWSEDEIDLLIRYGLPKYNENTIISPKKLKSELAEIRKQGFSVDEEEETIGSRCIGAPIYNQVRRIVAAISIAGYKQQINPESFQSLTQNVKETASEISEKLSELDEVSGTELV